MFRELASGHGIPWRGRCRAPALSKSLTFRGCTAIPTARHFAEKGLLAPSAHAKHPGIGRHRRRLET